MKIYHLLPIALIVSFNLSIAQQACNVSNMNVSNAYTDLVSNNIANAALSSSSTYSNTTGSPYLAETFEASKIYFNNELVGTFYTRYNAFSKEIEVKKTKLEGEKASILNKNEDIRIVYNEKEIQYTSFLDLKGKKYSDYLVSMTNGLKYGLYKRINVKFRSGQEAQNSYQKATPSRFTNSVEYFIKENQTNLIGQIPLKKSKLIKLFNNSDGIQVANLIKKESLRITKNQDLIKILDFANTLDTNYVLTN